ncbi:polysaccharide biosynthesis/export family protein [Photobacterium piscicola]|uniref:Polysaccharide biosynthesis/export family protein n=1 Tax=Photobacterium piscicola TaxID=1378299 RepID=A0ABU6LGF2_9GAMM|nr:polysaccharide biosynthesis/export family protein [Photobacterium piscicola]MEC6882771.1 polysaccharide biosynthesis/export family protein [Photobacterium piscicola]MEC6898651.1 polysaccharide biosynthesis/export family protein [Photobacterium piscicola]
MKKIISIILVLTLSLFMSTLASAASRTEANDYLLGAGDHIQILVFNEPDLSMKLIIDSSGNIMYPLIGQLQLIGKTPNQIAIDIRNRLKDGYLNNPMVTVIMLEFRPVYVFGEVKTPGSYEYQPGLTVEKVIAVAGGFTDRADRNDIDIRRSNDQLLKDVKVTQAIYPGDIVIIDQSFF